MVGSIDRILLEQTELYIFTWEVDVDRILHICVVYFASLVFSLRGSFDNVILRLMQWFRE